MIISNIKKQTIAATLAVCLTLGPVFNAQAESTDNSNFLIGAFVIGLTALLLSGGNSEAAPEEMDRYYEEDQQYDSSSYDVTPPDTSIGCAWGDRKYGTCH